jgi:hypothetical protein
MVAARMRDIFDIGGRNMTEKAGVSVIGGRRYNIVLQDMGV